jgi:hypothetical protein
MTTLNRDCPLKIEHYDHTSVEINQYEQWQWVNFLNLSLRWLLLCARTHPSHSFCLQVEEDGQGESAFRWLTSLSGSLWCSSIFHLQGGYPDEGIKELIGWCPSAILRTWCSELPVNEIVELVLRELDICLE